MLLANVPRQALHQPEMTGYRGKSQCALEMRQAGLPELLPGLKGVSFEVGMRQLNTQHYLMLMAMQANLVILFEQLDLLFAAIQTVAHSLAPTVRRC